MRERKKKRERERKRDNVDLNEVCVRSMQCHLECEFDGNERIHLSPPLLSLSTTSYLLLYHCYSTSTYYLQSWLEHALSASEFLEKTDGGDNVMLDF